VRTVAVCPGSGGRLVPLAAASGADVFVTGEVRYHNMREAEHHGIAIVELGHDRTEMPAVDLLARLIRGGLAAAGSPVPVAIYKEPRAAQTAAGR
jgi:putative NIF3 family GTP cyclohydrolase 1 type 2